MVKQNDPLSALLSNETKTIDRGQLVALLEPFLSIDQESKEFNFRSAFFEINGNSRKIEILLAGAKARALLFDEPDGLLPGEIIALEIMPTGSVKSSLKGLFSKEKRIKQDKEGRYFIPAYRISILVKEFNDN